MKRENVKLIKSISALTPLQEGMLFHSVSQNRKNKDTGVGNSLESSSDYVFQEIFELKGNVKREALRVAVKMLFTKHDILKTSILYKNLDIPKQVIFDDFRQECEEYILLGLEESVQQKKKNALLENARKENFDLQEDCLFRVMFIKLSEDSVVMAWTYHHVILDSISIEILFEEWKHFYGLACNINKEELQRIVESEKASLGSFKDYVDWLEAQDKSKAIDYWRSYLAGFEETTQIHSINKKSKEVGTVESQSLELNKNIQEAMEKAANNKASVKNVAEAVFGVLLQKYNNTKDVVFAKTDAGRYAHVRNIEQMAGLFIHTIPQRIRCEVQETFQDILESVVKEEVECSKYSYCPLSDIQSVAVQKNNLLSILFVFEDKSNKDEHESVEGVECYKEAGKLETEFAVTFRVAIYKERAVLDVFYNTENYGAEEMKRLLLHYKNILVTCLEKPGILIDEISAITDEEYERVIKDFNKSECSYQEDKTIIQLFEEKAEEIPDAIALILNEDTLTYREFNHRANQLANRLIDLGIKSNDFVVIIAQRSMEMILSIYAVMKTGAAYVPIDPFCPKERKQYMIEDCQPKVILTYGENREADVPVIALEDKNLWEGNSTNPVRRAALDDAIYCIYTSGTTGKPKGVVNTNRGLLNLIQWMQEKYQLTQEDAILQKTTYIFDVSASEILWWGIAGARLVLLNQGEEKSPSAILEVMEKHDISIVNFVPSMLSVFLMSIENVENLSKKLKSLRYVIAAGEALNAQIVNQFITLMERNQLKGRLDNIYGPTEASVYSTYFDTCSINMDAVPIGKPIGNSKAYILQNNICCGIGIAGELCIAGAGLARGYLNRDELNAEKFIENPFGSGKLYRTGDLARWTSDGIIEYLGRIDEQVKIRGFRIELGEIESLIRKLDYIKDAAVIIKNDLSGDKCIVAYMVSDQHIEEDEVKKYLGSFLPDYMLPAYFMQIEKVPVTPNGKLDRRSLPDIVAQSKSPYRASRNKEEELLCWIFSEVLGVEKAGIYDNFFELGGDSIKAIRITSKARKEGYELSVKDILQKGSIEQIARCMVSTVEKNSYEQGEVNGTIIETPIVNQFAGYQFVKPEHFNQDILFSIPDAKADDVRKVVKALAIHHDILRGVYRDGVLTVLPEAESSLCEFMDIDLSGIENAEERLAEYATKIQSSMDLENGPLMKAVLFTTNSGKKVWICIHHLLVDGISWRIIEEDFFTGLSQVQTGKDVALPEKTASYKEWAKLLEEYKESPKLKTEQKYWETIEKERVQGELIGKEETGESGHGAFTFTLSYEMTDKLLHNTRKPFHTEITPVLISALAAAVKKTTGQEKICVGLEGHGREEIHKKITIDRTVGWFTSMYPVVLNCSDVTEECLIDTKETMAHIPNHGMGYGVLYSEKQHFEADIFFNYLGTMEEGEESAVVLNNTGIRSSEENDLLAGIVMSGIISENQFVMSVKYEKRLYAKTFMERLVNAYKEELIRTIQFCAGAKEMIMTASDYSATTLSQADFEQIESYAGGAQNIQDIYELSGLQQGMLYHNLAQKSAEYIIQNVYELKDGMNLSNIQDALWLMVAKCDALRTVILYEKVEKPWQICLKEQEFELEVLDWSEKERETQKQLFEEIKKKDIERGFALQSDSLFRAKLLLLGEGKIKMIWTFHHIVVDGWCMALLRDMFVNSYEALHAGKTKEDLIKEQDAQRNRKAHFADYIVWLNEQEQGEEYWKQLLDDYDESAKISPLPSVIPDKTYENEAVEKVERQSILLEEDLSQRLLGLAAYQNITINTIAETIWGILLAKYNGIEDVVFGKVVSGRNAHIPGIEQMVGIFINTIPVRLRIEKESTILSVLKEIQKQAVDSSQYDHCALSKIQEIARQSKDFIQTLFVFENYASDKEELASQMMKLAEEREETNYALTVLAGVDEGRLRFTLMYREGEYATKEIENLCNKMKHIAKNIAFAPEELLEDISLADEKEKACIIEEFNHTKTIYPSDKTVVELFKEQVEKHKEKTALVFGETRISYQDLEEKSDSLASKLHDKGVVKGDYVAVIAKRSLEMVVAIHAILKCGAAYVPIDPKYPDERIQYMIEDCKPRVVLGYDVTLQTKVSVINLHDEELWCDKTQFDYERVNPQDIAYVIYTSGTTGQPKGVMVTHRNIVKLVKNCDYTSLTEDTVILQTGQLAFDASTFEVWGSMLNGGELHLIEEETLLDSRKMKAYITEQHITNMFITVALFNQLILEDKDVFASLKELLTGGEMVSEETIKIMRDAHPEVRLCNVYGPTETTTFAVLGEIKEKKTRTPIGKPISNTQVYVLRGTQLCGIGETGELCIAGDGVSKGYLNSPDLTSQKFVDNPFVEGKMYRSGDLCRWTLDGEIECLGRIDQQVKIRGFRIEPADIAENMRLLEDVTDAVVIVKEDEKGDKQLCAYYIAANETSSELIKKALAKSLPNYMIPKYMMEISAIPVTPNGKVDKHALPEIVMDVEMEYVEPESELERAVCAAFAKVLEIEKVGATDNFFKLGGHSIKAMGLINQIELKTGKRLSIKEILNNSTPRLLARVLEQQEMTAQNVIPIAEKKKTYRMSAAQRRIFYVCQMETKAVTYNIPFCYKISQSVSPEKLKRALSYLMERHEILRTGFELQDGNTIQRIYETVEPDFVYEERTIENIEGEMEQFIKPFSLERPPLIRMKLVKTGEEAYLLFLDVHHIVGDGMSYVTILKELSAFYQGETLEPLVYQFKDYSEWANAKERNEMKEYWVSQFSDDVPVLDLPLDYPRPAFQSHKGAVVAGRLSRELSLAIKNFAHKNQATEYMVFLSAAMVMLQKYSRQEDIVIGGLLSGREQKETAEMIGMFVNTLAFRGQPERNKTYQKFLEEIKQTCLKAYENQDYPFEDLVEAIHVTRDMSRNPLFDVLLVLQNNEKAVLNLGKGPVENVEIDSTISKFDLKIELVEEEEGFKVYLEYCKDLFQKDSIEYMLSHYRFLLETLIENPQKAIGDYEMADENEKTLILGKFNDTAHPVDLDRTVVDLYLETVEHSADKVALAYQDRTMTYQVLHEKVESLASQLLEYSVGANDFVMIVANRNFEMIIAMLAILRAGAAYVPVDPTIPKDRIHYIANDSRAKVILKACKEEIYEGTIPVIDLLEENRKVVSVSGNLPVAISTSDAAYCIYTSGTTGRPKGVVIEHKSLMNNIAYSKDKFTSGEIRIPLFTNYSFDLSIPSFYLALCYGGRIDLMEEERELDIADFMESDQYTFMKMTPSHLKMMESGTPTQIQTPCTIVTGGEFLDHALVKKIRNMYGSQVTIINEYGPTEATVGTTIYDIPEEMNGQPLPIGKPIWNLQVYIMDGEKLCGVKVPGELCIAGIGVARGYLNNETLTKEKFIDCPFCEGKLYRTGDLARWLPDGNIECLGRIDEQVKLNGHRIELGEIESCLKQYPGIRDAAALVKETERTGIYAYYVAEQELAPEAIRTALLATLPDYMVPSFYTLVERIPITKNGKIDKRALEKIEVEVKQDCIAPRNEIERVMCDIFAEVLGIDNVGITDNFFMLGGDSIKAIRIVSKLRERGFKLYFRDLMKFYTIAGIASYVKQEEESEYEQGEVTGKVIPTQILRMFQKWNLKKPEHFNQDMTITLDTGDEKLICQALDAVVKHHDVLRAVYRKGELIIRSAEESKLYDFDVYDLDNRVQVDAIQEIYTKAQESMCLENGPLVKALLMHQNGEHKLVLIIHHLLVDGVSWRIIMEDFQTALQAAKDGREIKLPAKTASFIQWSEALEAYKDSKMLKRELNWWKDVYGKRDIGRLQIKKESQETGYKTCKFSVSRTWTEQLLYQIHAVYHTQANDILLSALVKAVKEWTGQDELMISLEGHGREQLDKEIAIDRTVGWFTIKYPVMLKCKNEIEDNIIETKETLRRTPNNGIGYGAAGVFPAMIPADVSFNYLGEMDSEQPDAKTEFYTAGKSNASENNNISTLDMNAYVEKKELVFLIEYDSAKIGQEQMGEFVSAYQKALEDILELCLHSSIERKTASDYKAARDLTENDLKKISTFVGGWDKIEDVRSLTSLQEGLLFHHIAETDSTDYVIQHIFTLDRMVNETYVKQAFLLLIKRHDVLRSSILYEDLSKPYQVVRKDYLPEYNWKNMTGLSKEEAWKQIKEISKQDVQRGFKFEKDSLIRLLWIHTDDNDYLMWTYHHIIADGWCASVLFTDYIRYYNLLNSGMSYKVAYELVTRETEEYDSYGDYICWLNEQDQEEGLSYWEDLISDYEETAVLEALEKPEPVEAQMNRIGIAMSDEMTEKLKEAAGRNNVTVNTFLEVATGLLLQHYNNTEDVVFGKVVSGRKAELKGIDEIAGLFINTIPVRVKADTSITVRELIQKVQEQGMNSEHYSYCPLQDIQKYSQQKKELFEVLYAFENYYVSGEKAESDGLHFLNEVAREQTNYPITISCNMDNGNVAVEIIYNPNEYVETEINRILEHFRCILTEMINHIDEPACKLSMITEQEKETICQVFNDTVVPYPSNRSVGDLFCEQAAKTPEKTVVIFNGQTMSYQELLDKSGKVASELRKRGVGPGEFVAIMAEKNLNMICGICGIVMAGGAYVPIDPKYPEDRIQYILEDAQPKAVITFKDETRKGFELIKLSDEFFEGKENVQLTVENEPDDLIYAIYTSGTTGKPKGSLISHKSVIRLVKNTNYVEWNEDTVVLQTGSISFDASTMEIWGPLLNGGTLIIAENDVITSSDLLSEEISKNAVNTMWLTSSLYNFMIQENVAMFDTMKYLMIGGERLSEKHVRMLKEHKSNVRLINGYGPTENTTFTATYEIPEEFDYIPIGKPIANTQIYIQNHGNLCGIGVKGELCITGAGLSKGYLNQPELNREKYEDNPYGEGKLYHSGDLARWRSDGNIEFLGRIDDQVKIRGFRIELEEIEKAIKKFSYISDAAVIVRVNEQGDKALCAYVCSDEKISYQDLRAELAESLPDYMIPPYILQLGQLPVTRNGKLDKRALPEIEAESDTEFLAPENEPQKVLCNAFEQILGIHRVGILDSFYELGGDSIKAIRIVSKVRSAGYQISINDILKYYTIQAISQRVTSIESDKIQAEQEEVTGRIKDTPIIQAFKQWKLAVPEHFNQDVMFQTVLNKTDVERAVNELVRHHDMLRGVFRNDTLEVLSIEESNTFAITYFDFTSKELDEDEIGALCTEIQQSISLEYGLLLKGAMFATAEGNYVMLCVHHLVMDGVSFRILMEDFRTLEQQIVKGEELSLPYKTTSYKKWAEYLDEYRTTFMKQEEKEYWNNIYDRMSAGRLEMDLVDSEPGYAECKGKLTKEETTQLLYEAGKTYHTEINDLLLAALAKTMEPYTENDLVTVILEGHGRRELHKKIDIDRTIGWFTNLYPIVLSCGSDCEEVIIKTKEMLRKVPNYGMGYGMMENLPKSIPADLCFNYLGVMEFEQTLPSGLTCGNGTVNENKMQAPISFSLVVKEGELCITIIYDKTSVEKEEIQDLLEEYIQSLHSCIAICVNAEEEYQTLSDISNEDIDLDDLAAINEFFGFDEQ